MSGAEARHQVANLLHTYVEIADRKDVAGAVALLGDATVVFPSGGFARPEDAADFFAGLWAGPLPHRHDVTNLIVEPLEAPAFWAARAHYTRWVLEPGPTLHTLGAYDLVVAADPWRIMRLTVTRTWTAT